MKIGELDMHCGECVITELCGDPFDDVCLCKNPKLAEKEESEYLKKALELQEGGNVIYSNADIETLICRER